MNTRAIIAIAALALADCEAMTRDPTPESEFLEKQLIPAMIEWSNTSSPVMELNKYPAVQTFQYICAVTEYKAINIVEEELPKVRRYRGSTSSHVPEMKVAIVGVKGNVAHVAYVSLYDMAFHIVDPPCRSSKSAVLFRKESKRRLGRPAAALGG